MERSKGLYVGGGVWRETRGVTRTIGGVIIAYTAWTSLMNGVSMDQRDNVDHLDKTYRPRTVQTGNTLSVGTA
jgi:hypothetical protein